MGNKAEYLHSHSLDRPFRYINIYIISRMDDIRNTDHAWISYFPRYTEASFPVVFIHDNTT